MENLVAITKVVSGIDEPVKKAIRLAGGMETIVNKGDEIYLKPNFVAPRASYRGVTTNLEIIRIVAEEVRRCGGTPILFETPAIEFEKEKVYEVLEVYDFVHEHDINFLNDFKELLQVPVPNGTVFKSIKIPKVLHNAKIINLPKLKTHVSAKMTCGMKNLIGLLPDSEKRRVHIWGVSRTIPDIYRVLQPVLTVVDGITCMEGDGPTYGDKIELGLIISGRDVVATDKVCSQIIGIPWKEVPYLHLVDGKKYDGEITIIGESIEGTQVNFKIPEKSGFYHLSDRLIHILDVIFSKLFSGHFNQFLYSTGYLGTNPKIIKENCDRCGDCVDICPVENVIKIEDFKVDYKKCIRCLECYFACQKAAIVVKGFSCPERR